MVETPAAALEIDLLAKEVDFLCVGTNDLMQFVFAVDRNNENVSYLYNPCHPSFLRIMKGIIDAAKFHQTEVTVCGEIASDPLYLIVLLGLGFHRLSMNAFSIPKVKTLVRQIELTKASRLVDTLMGFSSYKEVQRHLDKKAHEWFPHYFQ